MDPLKDKRTKKDALTVLTKFPYIERYAGASQGLLMAGLLGTALQPGHGDQGGEGSV